MNKRYQFLVKSVSDLLNYNYPSYMERLTPLERERFIYLILQRAVYRELNKHIDRAFLAEVLFEESDGTLPNLEFLEKEYTERLVNYVT